MSTATRQRVLETARQMGYDLTRLREPEGFHAEVGTIVYAVYRKNGVIVNDSPFFSELAAGVEKACRQLSYALTVRTLTQDKPLEKQLHALPFCNGMILLGTELRPEELGPFLNLPFPVVVADACFDTIPLDYVLTNNFQGAYEAANYLMRRTKAQPGYLRSTYRISNFEGRARGVGLGLGGLGVRQPGADGEIPVGPHAVKPTVGEAGALLGGGFGGADVHAAVDEHGVGGEEARAEAFGEGVGEGGLAGGGGAREAERGAHGARRAARSAHHWRRMRAKTATQMALSATLKQGKWEAPQWKSRKSTT